jgi:hypothetical protein
MQITLPVTSILSNAEKAKLWAAADKLRDHTDAAEHKHSALGLIFLTYTSDAFAEHYAFFGSGARPSWFGARSDSAIWRLMSLSSSLFVMVVRPR